MARLRVFEAILPTQQQISVWVLKLIKVPDNQTRSQNKVSLSPASLLGSMMLWRSESFQPPITAEEFVLALRAETQ